MGQLEVVNQTLCKSVILNLKGKTHGHLYIIRITLIYKNTIDVFMLYCISFHLEVLVFINPSLRQTGK